MKKIFLFLQLAILLILSSCENVGSNAPLQDEADTISSFFGHQLIMNDSVLQQIEAIATNDDFLFADERILKTGNVEWEINVNPNSVMLSSNLEPDNYEMVKVINYLNMIYGKPYEDEEDGFDIKWSSLDDPQDIYFPGSTLVHLRRVNSDKGGTILMFN